MERPDGDDAGIQSRRSMGRAIESVQQQTLTSWELVIVDDGSTDTTLEVAQRYALSDPRIKIVRNESNVGIGKSRNHALAHSTGRFITPLDSDDWYHPERLERLVVSADEHNAHVLSDDLLVVRDGDDAPTTTLSELCSEPLDQPLHIDMAALLRRLGIERDGIALGLTKLLISRQFLVDTASPTTPRCERARTTGSSPTALLPAQRS